MIVAVDETRAIGKDNKLLWNIPEDLKHFKELTTGHTVIMGKNTYHAIGRPLPNRTNIVVTIHQDLALPGCLMAHSIDEAVQIACEHEKEEVFVIGGASIYKQCLPLAERLYLTLVEGTHDADTFFPDYSDFRKIVSEEKSGNETYQYTYFVLERAEK
ncbi:MAG: dihydrofolate reductase [Candidatus Moranbacteria bacterium]|nr:dihydrofolate reductase [Candidatus Moranbacteria bacterium]